MLSASKNMKLIIIWDQVVACRKMKKKKKGGILLLRGVNSLLLLTYLVCLLSRKAGFNQEGGINRNRNRAQRTPGAGKTLAANVCFARGACQRARTRTLVFSAQHVVFCLLRAGRKETLQLDCSGT